MTESDQQRITRCKRLRFAPSKFCLRRNSFTPKTLYDSSQRKRKVLEEIMG